MTKDELKAFEETLLKEFRDHKQTGGFDVHAAHITRLYEAICLIVQHLNKK